MGGWEKKGNGGWNLVCLAMCEWDLCLNLVWAHNPIYEFVFLNGVGMTGWGTKQGAWDSCQGCHPSDSSIRCMYVHKTGNSGGNAKNINKKEEK